MSLTITVLFFLFILPVLGGVMLYRHARKSALLLFSIPVLVFLLAVGWWVYETNEHFVRSTDLADEGLGEVKLQSVVDDQFKATYGAYTQSDNSLYKESLRFYGFHLGTNEDDWIIYLKANSSAFPTQKGIRIGDSIQDVLDAYGDHYDSTVEQGMSIIGYVDRRRRQKINLQFWHYEGVVKDIRMYLKE